MSEEMPNQTILIIDDSPDIHELVQLGLAGEPVDFISCFSGEDGLAKAASLHPDLILLDVGMTGMDGFEVCRRLKADPLTTDAPIVFLTGASTTEENCAASKLARPIMFSSRSIPPNCVRVCVRPCTPNT